MKLYHNSIAVATKTQRWWLWLAVSNANTNNKFYSQNGKRRLKDVKCPSERSNVHCNIDYIKIKNNINR